MLSHPRIGTLTALAAATLIASTAIAAPTLPGINIRWDNCFSDGGVMNKTFACDTNTGAEQAVMSVQLDTEMLDVVGFEVRVSLKTSDPTLPAWWAFKNLGSCRRTSLGFVNAAVPPGGSCLDWSLGTAAPGVGAYNVDALGPGSAVIIMATAIGSPLTVALDPVTEYIVGALHIDHAKTVGTGSCGGCTKPVCILFTSLVVSTPVAANNRLLTQGANTTSSQIIHWQNGQLQNLVNSCTDTFHCTTQFDCVNAGPTDVHRNTWGEVKSLYR